MFKLVKDPVSKWPVQWNAVSAEGEIVPQELVLKLVRVGRDEFNHHFDAERQMNPEEELDLFMRLVRDWQDVIDAAGDPLPFTRENAARLLDLPGFALAFTQAYMRFWFGRAEEREKNSVPSPAGKAEAAGRTGGKAASAKA